jgi:biotin operon repressor
VLSVVLCNAWDGSELVIRSRGAGISKVRAGEYVLGMLGAATDMRAMEAVMRNNGQMAHAGLANRSLWFPLPSTTISLPFGGGELPWSVIYDYRTALGLREVHHTGIDVRGPDPGMTPDAEKLWAEVYDWLRDGSKRAEGEIAKLTLGRAEAQVRRLSLLFCLSRDSGPKAVSEHDLLCALSIWEFCRAGARFLFAPERTVDAPSRYDNEVRRAIYALLGDPTHPGWISITALAEELRKDRGTVTHHVQRLARDGILIEGVARTGKRGKPPRVVALRRRWAERKLGPRSEGKGSKSGIELAKVRWVT